MIQRISTCLWSDDQAQEAAEFYVGLFPNSSILQTTHYGEGGQPGQCGWLTDQFGVSQRAFAALMQMTKLDLPALQRAYDGA